jgi:hypothetical protein
MRCDKVSLPNITDKQGLILECSNLIELTLESGINVLDAAMTLPNLESITYFGKIPQDWEP